MKRLDDSSKPKKRPTPPTGGSDIRRPAPKLRIEPEHDWHRLHIQITQEHFHWLNEKRFKTGKSLAHIIRDALDRYSKWEG